MLRLNKRRIVPPRTGKVVRIHQPAHRVPLAVLAARVELPAKGPGDVEQLLVDGAGDLDVGFGLDELHAGDGAGGHDARAVPLFGAPGDDVAFGVADPVCR